MSATAILHARIASQRSLLFLCLTQAIVLAAGACQHADAQVVRPNIVMVLVDDMGHGDLSPQRLPFCSQLARRGATLSLYTHQNCVPTRAALMTGQYPHRLGQSDVWPTSIEPGLPPNVKVVPEYLTEAGYTCGVFGKWHLGWQQRAQWPDHQGFAEFIGCLGGHINGYGPRQLGFPFDDGSIGHDHHDIHDMQWNGVPLYCGDYSTKLFADAASRFVEKRTSAGEPFFLYVPFNSPHGPYSAPRHYVEAALATHIPHP